MDDAREYWNEDAGLRWVREQSRLDAMMVPIWERLATAANVRPGQRVLDIGCGCGTTSLDLADQVGEQGAVVGVDISQPMVDRARELAAGRPQLRFEVADAGAHAFSPGATDVAVSRFGVMFFADSVAAFSNIRRGLASAGRCVFTCWQGIEANPWVSLALRDAKPLLPAPQADNPEDDDQPGMFRFADPKRVERVMVDAGFSAVSVQPSQVDLTVPGTVDEVLAFFAEMGPLGRVLSEVADDRREEVLEIVRGTIAADHTGQGVCYPSATWIVSGTNR